jgi:hypothetical protein
LFGDFLFNSYGEKFILLFSGKPRLSLQKSSNFVWGFFILNY